MLWLQSSQHDCLSVSHYGDVIMSRMASQITSLTIVYSAVWTDTDQRKCFHLMTSSWVKGFLECWFSIRGTSLVITVTTTLLALNTSRPRQDGRLFANDILKCIFLNENVSIAISVSLKFVWGPVNNIPTLAQIMAWRRPGDKPLFEPLMVSFPTQLCVTRPQWVNCDRPSAVRMLNI